MSRLFDECGWVDFLTPDEAEQFVGELESAVNQGRKVSDVFGWWAFRTRLIYASSATC
jgi:hypothetical protein